MKRLHYAWVILGLCFFGLLAAQGTRGSFGAFVTPWEADFGVDRATVSFAVAASALLVGAVLSITLPNAAIQRPLKPQAV